MIKIIKGIGIGTKFHIWIALLIIISSFIACTNLEEQYLDEALGSELTGSLNENFSEDGDPEGSIASAINPVYASLASVFTAQDGIFALQQNSTDETMLPTRGTDWDDGGVWRVLHTHQWDKNHRIISAAWNTLNQGVARAYTALDILDLLTNTFSTEVTETTTTTMVESDTIAISYDTTYTTVDTLSGDGFSRDTTYTMTYQTEDTTITTETSITKSFGSEDLLKNARAEVRTLRAWYMFHLMDLFGQVPYSDENDESKVYTRPEAYAFITSELEAVIPDLGAKDELDYGKINKSTARAIAAKVYLNAGVYDGTGDFSSENMDKVIAHADEIANTYSIASDYFSIFAVDNSENPTTEPLLVVENDNTINRGPSQSRTMMTLHYNQKLGRADFEPWNGFVAVADFYNKWGEDGDNSNGITTTDVRYYDDRTKSDMGVNLGILVGQQFNPDGSEEMDRNGNPLVFTVDPPHTGATETDGVRVLKYTPDNESPAGDLSNGDFILLRYSDVLLMKAEALFRKGNSAGALIDINTLREVRKADPLSAVTLDAILDERSFELYWEGHRRNDLIRFNKFTDVWDEKPQTDASKNLFPIPQSAIDVNPLLKQNEGY